MYVLEISLLTVLFSVLCHAQASPSSNTQTPPVRIGDVLDHLDQNGGVHWTELADGSRYTTHTQEEWQAAEQAVAGHPPKAKRASLHARDFSPDRRWELDSFSREPIPAGSVNGGLDIAGKKGRSASFYCMDSGQWGSVAPLMAMADQACKAVFVNKKKGDVKTWTSLGYVQADHHTAAWFIQASGDTGGDATESMAACKKIFEGWATGGGGGGSPGGSWCEGKNTLGQPDGPYNTQGGMVRWFDSSSWISPDLGEFRIDPNQCNKNGKPCSNWQNLAKTPAGAEKGDDHQPPP
ncbi:MAG: hypothetical protein Q9160_005972 [Pyrenula sp. 1 TL-2023]